jgi:hypothetical protein
MRRWLKRKDEPMAECFPVLTVRQPWAWAIGVADAELRKPVENRSWYMGYRGPLWLHAGARSRWDPDGAASPLLRMAWDQHVQRLPGWPGLPVSDVTLGRRTTLMPFGAVVALVEVTGCHHDRECSHIVYGCGNWVRCTPWSAGWQYHIEMTPRHVLAEPVPCRGHLGLWQLPEDVELATRAQLGAETPAAG